MKIFIYLLLIISCHSALAEIQLPVLFSDGMVLQQKAKVPVWGWAVKGRQVEVVFNNQTKITTVDDNGKWMLHLDPLKASAEPSELKITVGPESKTIKNVLVGEVWLCSGQSNMDYTIRGLLHRPAFNKKYQPISEAIKKEILTARDPLFRQIVVKEYRNSHFKKFESFKGRWIESSPQNNGAFTATGYFFGRQLRDELKVPVALIKSAWGGTMIQPWIPKNSYQANAALKKYYEQQITSIKQQINTWDEAKAQSNYEGSISEWEKQKKDAIAASKKIPRKPRPAQHPERFTWVPSTLYNAMIHPLVPYSIKGVIWYQGESNVHRAELYGQFLTSLISGWREAWNQGDFPFYYAQLANWENPRAKLRKGSPNPVDNVPWATVCNQQRLTLKVKNTGMAVLHDIGEAEDIHPKNKIDVGKRLALWALAKDYGKNIIFSGPLYKSSEFTDSKVIISFSSAGEGLMVGKKELLQKAVEVALPLKGFQICGSERVWKWAEAKIISKDKVEVYSSEIESPTEVRYAWAQNAEGSNLYNKNGLPTSVFKAIKHTYQSITGENK